MIDRHPAGAGGATGEGARAAHADADRLLEVVEGLVAELRTGVRGPVRLDSDLQRDLGLDSLAVVELFDRVESAFGVRLAEEVLTGSRTPADWLDALRRALRVSGPDREAAPPGRRIAREVGEAWPAGATTFTEALAWHAEAHPELVSVQLLGASGAPDEVLTYGELAREAARLARGLRARGVAPGERVAVMLPTGRAYLTVFLGILEAGAVPVPIYPPASRAVVEEHFRRYGRVLANAGVVLLVTVAEARPLARLLRAEVPSLRGVELVTSLLAAETGVPDGTPARAGAEDLALVQYTSGSTGDPKGVTLTHAELLANIAAMGQAAQVSSADAFVSWLPLYHDMGLIGAFLAPLFFGFPLVLLSPLRFLARPASWLEAISRYGGTISAAPDFAYEACVERIGPEVDAELDLSSWRIAFDGSEPISPRTLERFAARFARCGLRRSALCPAYGLAEAGVGVTFTPLGRGPRVDVVEAASLRRRQRAVPAAPGAPGARAIVSCGVPVPGLEVRIAGPLGEELPDRREGSVLVRGPSTTKGYLGNERANAALFAGGWLVTGDLGYIADGELYLTGRSKDVVIRGGRNLHPAELEEALAELDGVHGRGVAAFASTDERRSTERLVVAIETSLAGEAERASLRAAALRRAAAVLDAPPDEVVLVPPRSLPRTPSGKLRRAATREAYEAGRLARPPAPFAVQMARVAAAGLGARAGRLSGEVATWGTATLDWAAALCCAAVADLAVHLPVSLQTRWRIVRAIGGLLGRACGTTVRVEGSTAMPRPCVVVANHASFVDGLVALLAFEEPVVFVTSVELERTPLVGSFLRRIGCVFVERGRPERAPGTLVALEAVVRGGGRLFVFPEGAISRAPGLRGFHLGAFAVAARVGCPVVPVAIRGTRDVLRPGTYVPRRGAVVVAPGTPIEPSGTGFEAALALRDAARAALASASGEHLR